VLVLAAGCGGGGGAPSGDELERLARPPVPTPLASERIYFVLTDRYDNADPSNDRGGETGDRRRTGFDPADTGYYHGGDLKGLTRGLQRIKDLGFTAIWITPPVKQQSVQGSSAAYHGYWGLDFTTVDPHLGTEADFATFIESAHRLGLKVIQDVVVNHTADVIFVGGSYSDAPYRNCNETPFDPERYAGGATFPCLDAAGMPNAPVLVDEDAHLKQPEWLNDVTAYHNRGDIDFGSCSEQCFEQGDFYGLDDLFTEQPRVVDGLADVYAGWIRKYKVDGFRIDTARHVDREFFHGWVPQARAAARAAGVRDFELFGEVFDDDSTVVAPFVTERGLPNVLDFPFQAVAAAYAGGGSSAVGLQQRFEDDDYYRTPSGVAVTPPTFLGNHDMGRAAQQITANGGASGDELLRRLELGYALLYLLRGAPVVYYGDEIGMAGLGGDKAARQDMFPTQVAEWRTEPRVGAPPIGSGSGLALEDHPLEVELRELAALRDRVPALSTGSTTVRHAKGGVLVVSRIDARTRREELVAFNNGTSPARVTVRTATPSSSWRALLGERGARSDGRGRTSVEAPALGAVLLQAAKRVPTADEAPTPKLAIGPDDFTDLTRVRAHVAGATPVTVAFAIRRDGGDWTRLAVDDAPPFRAYVDRSRFPRGKRVEVLAVARTLDGKTALSNVSGFVPRR
jgi:glycosidase